MCIKIVVGGGLLCNCHCYDYARDEFPRLEFAIESQITNEMAERMEKSYGQTISALHYHGISC